jgi:hypothetical protein
MSMVAAVEFVLIYVPASTSYFFTVSGADELQTTQFINC